MATGRDNQLTKQLGEYLVAAEICRRGFIATTFTGNVPHYDILASNETGRHQAIQVKAMTSSAWQFDIRKFVDVQLNNKRQVMGAPTQPAYPDLICVFVRLKEYGTDEFYVLTWENFQEIAIASYSEYLASHAGIRPKKHDSFHLAIRPASMRAHRDKWGILKSRLCDDVAG